nr:putative heat shock protein 70 family [Tanacetum cinerariifolium]
MEGRLNIAPVIGIDLGTTYSCVAVWKHGQIQIIANDQGNRTTPSSVAFLDEERLVGDGAKHQVARNPTNTIYDAKRLIGRRFSDSIVQDDMKFWPFKVIEGSADTPKIVVSDKGQMKEYSAEEISSMILRKMKETAEDYLGKPVKDAVVTVPAYFNDSQRQATKDAGTIAGLNIIRIISEPTAAAIAYGMDNKPDITRKMNVLIFDLGGGTFDVSLSTVDENGVFKVQAVAGDTHLGGEDFDNRMAKHCVREFQRKFNKDMTGNLIAMAKLRVECEKAKRFLSNSTQTSFEIDCDGQAFIMKFSRAKFEEINMDSFNKCITTVEKCLNDANIEKSYVDEIILVGGSTRIPKVQSMLHEFFDKKQLRKSVNPDEAVAYGAAVLAAKLSGDNDNKLRNLELLDVTPLSLGIEILGEEMSVVIPRNTPIPTKKAREYVTTSDNQSATSIKVFQGERARSTDNHFLGKFEISGIPPAPKGVPKIRTCLEIDVNGIITVTAEILSTGNTEKLIITNENGRLSKSEIAKMIRDAERYQNEDDEYKKKVAAYNALQDFLYNMKNKMDDLSITTRVKAESLEIIDTAIDDMYEWLEDEEDATVEELQRMKVFLELVCSPIT